MRGYSYYVERDEAGEVELLARCARGVWESLRDGVWVHHPSLLSMLYDALLEEISEQTAALIAPRFGGRLNDDHFC
jgi:hypothetical protein